MRCGRNEYDRVIRRRLSIGSGRASTVKLKTLSGSNMNNSLWRLWHDEDGQDIAEYAVMLAVILVLVVGTVRLVGSNANNAFSSAASSLQ